jgi:glycerol-3-phosphate dehydrogenase (NAD(P)+)
MNITILGAGAWGTALAIVLSRYHKVLLWGRNADAMAAIDAARENVARLPGFALPSSLVITADLTQAISHAADGLLILATSVAGLRPMLTAIKPYRIPNLVWLCKGIEDQTALLPHQIVQQVLGEEVICGTLSGPSFAQEVARGLPCALTIGATSAALRQRVVSAVHGGSVRVYSTDDLIGVEVGGAVKNILAIATGIIDGLGLGLNARAALITRGLAEIARLGAALGGRMETFMGLTGMGDLILTCTGDLSRNRRVGLGLAAGKSLQTINAELGHVAEGVQCVQAMRQLANTHHIDMPIVDAVARVLFEHEAPEKMVRDLLARESRDEGNSLR